MKKSRRQQLLGYLLFFLTTIFIVATSFVTYEIVKRQSPQIISIALIITSLEISLLLTFADVIRRKIMIERPLKEILKATEKIASGDFSVRLEPKHPYGSYDEYDLIKEYLNIMASDLSKSEILKSDFISNVSHEIKTPVAVIKNYSVLLEKENDPEKRAQYRRELVRASNRLSNLVGNILKLNKLENQELIVEKKAFRLDGALEEAIVAFESQIEKKELELECDLEEINIVSSESHLEIVWNNLISNAIKFTERGGKIGVSCKWVDGMATVEISDTGCGIDAETGKHIFDKFYQGDTSHSGEGNGLGLALVKRVIDTLGGEISVKSELGKGTTFTVRLK
ncbi:MAG: HAMP domain-containing histidine kinase [Clostridia bacterium]|nr:HAMP domain-containing histidine kinase [Clostridia bacterium]